MLASSTTQRALKNKRKHACRKAVGETTGPTPPFSLQRLPSSFDPGGVVVFFFFSPTAAASPRHSSRLFLLSIPLLSSPARPPLVVGLLDDRQPAEGHRHRHRSPRSRARRPAAVDGRVTGNGGGGGGRLGEGQVPADGVAAVPLQEIPHPLKAS